MHYTWNTTPETSLREERLLFRGEAPGRGPEKQLDRSKNPKGDASKEKNVRDRIKIIDQRIDEVIAVIPKDRNDLMVAMKEYKAEFLKQTANIDQDHKNLSTLLDAYEARLPETKEESKQREIDTISHEVLDLAKEIEKSLNAIPQTKFKSGAKKEWENLIQAMNTYAKDIKNGKIKNKGEITIFMNKRRKDLAVLQNVLKKLEVSSKSQNSTSTSQDTNTQSKGLPEEKKAIDENTAISDAKEIESLMQQTTSILNKLDASRITPERRSQWEQFIQRMLSKVEGIKTGKNASVANMKADLEQCQNAFAKLSAYATKQPLGNGKPVDRKQSTGEDSKNKTRSNSPATSPAGAKKEQPRESIKKSEVPTYNLDTAREMNTILQEIESIVRSLPANRLNAYDRTNWNTLVATMRQKSAAIERGDVRNETEIQKDVERCRKNLQILSEHVSPRMIPMRETYKNGYRPPARNAEKKKPLTNMNKEKDSSDALKRNQNGSGQTREKEKAKATTSLDKIRIESEVIPALQIAFPSTEWWISPHFDNKGRPYICLKVAIKESNRSREYGPAYDIMTSGLVKPVEVNAEEWQVEGSSNELIRHVKQHMESEMRRTYFYPGGGESADRLSGHIKTLQPELVKLMQNELQKRFGDVQCEISEYVGGTRIDARVNGRTVQHYELIQGVDGKYLIIAKKDTSISKVTAEITANTLQELETKLREHLRSELHKFDVFDPRKDLLAYTHEQWELLKSDERLRSAICEKMGLPKNFPGYLKVEKKGTATDISVHFAFHSPIGHPTPFCLGTLRVDHAAKTISDISSEKEKTNREKLGSDFEQRERETRMSESLEKELKNLATQEYEVNVGLYDFGSSEQPYIKIDACKDKNRKGLFLGIDLTARKEGDGFSMKTIDVHEWGSHKSTIIETAGESPVTAKTLDREIRKTLGIKQAIPKEEEGGKEKEGLEKAKRLLAEYETKVLPLMQEAKSLKNCSTAGVEIAYERLLNKVDNKYYESFDAVTSTYEKEVDELRTSVLAAREIHNTFLQKKNDVLGRASAAIEKGKQHKSAERYIQLLVGSITKFESMDMLRNSEADLLKAMDEIDKRTSTLHEKVETIDRNRKLVEDGNKLLDKFSKTELGDWVDVKGLKGESLALSWGIDPKIATILLKARSDVIWGIKRTGEDYAANDYRSKDLQAAVTLLESSLRSFEETLKQQKNTVTKYEEVFTNQTKISNATDKAVELAKKSLNKKGNLTAKTGVVAVKDALKAIESEVEKIKGIQKIELPKFIKEYNRNNIANSMMTIGHRITFGAIGKDVQSELIESLKHIIEDGDPTLNERNVTKLKEDTPTTLEASKKMLLAKGVTIERKENKFLQLQLDQGMWNSRAKIGTKRPASTIFDISQQNLPVLKIGVKNDTAITKTGPRSYEVNIDGVSGTLDIYASKVHLDMGSKYIEWEINK